MAFHIVLESKVSSISQLIFTETSKLWPLKWNCNFKNNFCLGNLLQKNSTNLKVIPQSSKANFSFLASLSHIVLTLKLLSQVGNKEGIFQHTQRPLPSLSLLPCLCTCVAKARERQIKMSDKVWCSLESKCIARDPCHDTGRETFFLSSVVSSLRTFAAIKLNCPGKCNTKGKQIKTAWGFSHLLLLPSTLLSSLLPVHN